MAFGLGGCLSDAEHAAQDGNFVARLRAPDASVAATPTHAEKINAESIIIQNLMARRSVLDENSAFDRVATSVLAANARSAESELRAAQLRARAASKNWLPQIGPNVSLTSLGTVVANLVIEQVVYDNGRRKGEREFAVADVEVAAVTLAADTNDRVATALALYLSAAEAQEKHALAERTAKDIGQFAWVMEQRVRGGVSDPSDLHILRQKLGEITADRAAQSEAAATARAELGAMSIGDLSGVSGLSAVDVRPDAAQPLSVTLAEAEKIRAVAAAKVDRANQLPGISATAQVGENGGAGLTTTSGTLLGLGTGDRLRAIEAAREAAARRVAQAQEDANRELRRLDGAIASKERQAAEAAKLTAQAKRNLDLFQAQYDGGQRQVMDVVGVYETYARQAETEIALKYDALRLRVEMAERLGLLADGSRI
ncbi:TolC family protein [Sulfitobacter sp. HNIBRBA3233]|uniref:TolC family protein n=1 Tax=Sulfitobacter marinivivus TaxID=3158558 RepID=UPI0032E0249C